MFLESITIDNYKSFRASDKLSFQPGFNVIVGENNTGKTALLQAISTDFVDAPHYSEITKPNVETKVDPLSATECVYCFPQDDFLQTVRDANTALSDTGHSRDVNTNLRHLKRRIASAGARVQCAIVAGRECQEATSLIFPQHVKKVTFAYDEGDLVALAEGSSGTDLAELLSDAAMRRVYAFKPERLNVSSSAYGDSSELQPDGSNLATVLNVLQSNPTRLSRFLDAVNYVLPSVKHVTSKPEGSNFQIRVWTIDPESERGDLAIPLSESGTGIGQVLAILYVVVGTDYPSMILIDEPQSFLHPGAARKLIDVLQDYKQHQFILATHSPAIISAAAPATITLLKHDGQETIIEQLDLAERENQEKVLAAVGARLSDVFGSDGVLWVEGRTEEECFPLILKTTEDRRFGGIQIKGVKHTGDFEQKDSRRAQLVLSVYRQLTEGVALVPPAVGFLFDGEGKSERRKTDLRKIGESTGVKVLFLKKRMFENYLLDESAIASVISELDDKLSKEEALESVEKWMAKNKFFGVKAFWKNSKKEHREPDVWTTYVDGARLLSELFKDVTSNRVNYDKVKHGLILSKRLIEEDPDRFAEIADQLAELLED